MPRWLAKWRKRGRNPESLSDNPFATAPGRAPAVLAGRDDELAQYRRVLTEGPNHRHFFSYLIGPRGYGKTVMLQEIRHQATAAEWFSVSLDGANRDLYERLHKQLLDVVATHVGVPKRSRGRKTRGALSVGTNTSASVAVETDTQAADLSTTGLTVRKCLELLTDAATKRNTGLMITIDELHDADPESVKRIGNDIQLVQGDDPDRWLSFVGAALPDMVEPDGLLEKVSTFLHRGRRIAVGALSDEEARTSLAGGYKQAGLTITEEALDLGVAAANGHPWYLQLVGHHTVDLARRRQVSHVSPAVSETGLTAAHVEAGPMLFAPVWGRLSGNDRALLTAIAVDGATSSAGQVRRRLGWSSQLVYDYSKRLEDRHLLVPSPRAQLVLMHQQVPMWIEQQLRRPLSQVFEDDALALETRTAAAVGQIKKEAHFNLVKALPSARSEPRCGVYGPRSKAPCVLPRGHKGQHRYR